MKAPRSALKVLVPLLACVSCFAEDDGCSFDLCRPCGFGSKDVLLMGPEDLTLVEGRSSIPGMLSICGQWDGGAIELPARLKSVLGTVMIAASDVSSLTISGLQTIGGALRVFGSGLPVLRLESLNDIGGALDVGSNRDLTTLSLPVLEQVEGDLWIRSNSLLPTLDLQALGRVAGDLVVQGNASLSSLQSPLLTSLGTSDPTGARFSVVNNPLLPTCQAEAIRDRLIGQGFAGSVTISGNDDIAVCQ